MARQKKPDRFICIEDRGRGSLRFRVHFVERGKRVAVAVGTAEEAEALERKVRAATAHLQTPMVAAMVESYITEMVERGKWRRDAKQYESKVGVLRRFFAPVADIPIGGLTETHMDKCCRAWDVAKRPAPSTRNNARVRAKAFFSWAIKARLLRSSPLDDGHMVRMPPTQLGRLRLDDARRLRSVVDPAAAQGDPSAVFVLAALLLGARTSELVGLTASSLDDGGRVISYPDAKNPAKVHVVRLPNVLVAPLRLLADAAEGGRLMRPRGRGLKAWGALQVRYWARMAGLAMAEDMDVRFLRRTKDSLAVEAGVSSEVVARETGHTLHVARVHYIQHGAETAGRAAAMDEATGTTKNGISTSDSNQAKTKAG